MKKIIYIIIYIFIIIKFFLFIFKYKEDVNKNIIYNKTTKTYKKFFKED